MTSTANHNGESTDIDLTCPVADCEFVHSSPQGIASHVGSGHDDGWADANGTAQDVHVTATVRDTAAFDRATRVREYLARNGVTTDCVRIFYHFGYENVQIRAGHIDLDEWVAFDDATDVNGIYHSREGLWYCDPEFVEQLPQSTIADVEEAVACGSGGCGRKDNLQRVTRLDRGARILCSPCGKRHLGVST